MKGKELQKAVVDFAHFRSWKVAHFPSVETTTGWRTGVAADGKGWPDLFLVRDRAVAIEIKGKGDTVKADQEDWHQRLRRAGVEVYVVTPSDWPDNVREILN